MSLSDQQFKFAKDVLLLLTYAEFKGWKFTLGEVQRPQEMQDIYLEEGKTTVSRSLHQDKLAVDINFFKPIEDRHGTYHQYTYNKEDLQELGDYWESLSPENEWGGNWESFVDTPHFQRNKI